MSSRERGFLYFLYMKRFTNRVQSSYLQWIKADERFSKTPQLLTCVIDFYPYPYFTSLFLIVLFNRLIRCTSANCVLKLFKSFFVSYSTILQINLNLSWNGLYNSWSTLMLPSANIIQNEWNMNQVISSYCGGIVLSNIFKSALLHWSVDKYTMDSLWAGSASARPCSDWALWDPTWNVNEHKFIHVLALGPLSCWWVYFY